MSGKSFSTWYGPDGINEYIKQQTGCNPFSGAGLNPRPKKKLQYYVLLIILTIIMII